jgi:hypothetical protein
MKHLLLIVTILLATPVFAQDINTQSIKDEGFDGVGQIIDQMTPEQKLGVMKQALEMQKELEKLPPAEREKILNDLKATAATVDASKVDVKKLDPSKTKSLNEIQKDVQEYNKSQGQK